jgi:hypothetical protein
VVGKCGAGKCWGLGWGGEREGLDRAGRNDGERGVVGGGGGEAVVGERGKV